MSCKLTIQNPALTANYADLAQNEEKTANLYAVAAKVVLVAILIGSGYFAFFALTAGFTPLESAALLVFVGKVSGIFKDYFYTPLMGRSASHRHQATLYSGTAETIEALPQESDELMMQFGGDFGVIEDTPNLRNAIGAFAYRKKLVEEQEALVAKIERFIAVLLERKKDNALLKEFENTYRTDKRPTFATILSKVRNDTVITQRDREALKGEAFDLKGKVYTIVERSLLQHKVHAAFFRYVVTYPNSEETLESFGSFTQKPEDVRVRLYDSTEQGPYFAGIDKYRIRRLSIRQVEALMIEALN